MDITETYIKMSDHPKIQEQWSPKVGDFCLPKKHKHPKIIIKNGTLEGYYLIGKLAVRRSSYDGYWGLSNYRTTLWLPRQDEIQGMFGLDNFQLAFKFAEYLERHDAYYLMGEEKRSMEQLWLALYMYEKHSFLKWDGDKWVK